MKKVFVCIIALIGMIAVNRPVFAEELRVPDVEAKGAILVDFETGRVLWSKNADEPLAMASTTKIMTAILALEYGKLDEMVTVSRRAAETPKVKMYLSAGEKIPLETLLYALMLQSSNDAAVAIAEHIGGSVEEFCRMMTERARELGAADTVFETPNGLDLGDHHSTAKDMALIARHAMRNQTFVDLVSTPSHTGKSDRRTYDIVNKNRMLTDFNGANGIKTGYTGKAGYCFVGSAKRGDLWLISVVLGSGWGSRGREQKWVDSKRILNYGFDNYHIETVVENGDLAGNVAIERSKTARVTAVYNETLNVPMTSAEKESVVLQARLPESLRAPVAVGDKLGICEIYIGGNKYVEIDILAASGAERHDLKTSMEKVLNSLLEIVTSNDVNITLPEF